MVAGTVPATTYLSNIRNMLNEPLSASDILIGSAGGKWTNTELLENLNVGKNKAWDLIRTVREDYFILTSQTINVTATIKEYVLPAGFRQLVGLKCTTAGYEDMIFNRVSMEDSEFKLHDAIPVTQLVGLTSILYCVVGTSTFKFADFFPTALTLTYDYIQIVTDFTLSASSTIDINDELRDFIIGYAIMWSFMKYPDDTRLPFWTKMFDNKNPLNLNDKLINSVSLRNIRDPQYVEDFNVYQNF